MAQPSLNQALAKLQKLAFDNAPLGARVAAEQQYGKAYQIEVAQGTKPQIRKKYRVLKFAKKTRQKN